MSFVVRYPADPLFTCTPRSGARAYPLLFEALEKSFMPSTPFSPRPNSVPEGVCPGPAGSIGELFDSVAPRYDFLNHLLSFGADRWWREKLVVTVRGRKPRRLLDLATGSGDLLRLLERHIEGLEEAWGVDVSASMLAMARNKGLRHLIQADALALPFAEGSFDAVTVAFGLRNFADRARAFAEMRRVLRPGGAAFILEFSRPWAWIAPSYFFYLEHLLPEIARFFGAPREAYQYLASSIAAFPRPEELAREMETAGFRLIRFLRLTGGIVALHEGEKEAA
ncbi:MAG: bifunctional demethylmenaquinone methyltransferase/2-methoxy-6-polyprenyl-1,4-benzoquinol methylase UbiE [Candidatus Methylacidiphilaceae bacterium]